MATPTFHCDYCWKFLNQSSFFYHHISRLLLSKSNQLFSYNIIYTLSNFCSWTFLVAQTVSICLQCGRPGFNPWVRKISWRRKWQATPLFLPGKSHGWRSLVDYSSWGHKESDMSEWLHSLNLLLMLLWLLASPRMKGRQTLYYTICPHFLYSLPCPLLQPHCPPCFSLNMLDTLSDECYCIYVSS